MPNPKYQKGYRKERKIVNMARGLGWIAFRSAGSHSPIDVVIIDPKNKTVRFIQCKSDKLHKSQKLKLEKEMEDLDGRFTSTFEVI